MKNSKLRRVLLLASCAVMLVCLSVGATLAYLTATATVTNTFTVGNVKITLDEAATKYDETKNEYVQDTNEDGSNKARVTSNQYKIRPGVKIRKDPTIHVEAGSEKCYIRAIVTVTYNKEADNILQKAANDNWIQNLNDTDFTISVQSARTETEGKYTVVYECRYSKIVDQTAASTAKDINLFKGINVPTELTGDDIAALAGLEIKIVAHAMQADGFATADLAWKAFDDSTASTNND